MAFNFEYPYTDSEKYNDDWLLQKMVELAKAFDEFVNLNSIKYADPILWDITSQYETNTVVIDPQTGNAYISTQPVPVGVSLSNTDYWTSIYNYDKAINFLMEQIAAANEKMSPTATAARNIGDLVWLQGELYVVTANMIAGDAYVEGSNCAHITIESILKNLSNSIAENAGDIANLELNFGGLVSVVNIVKSKLVKANQNVFGKVIFLGDSYSKWDSQAWPKWTDNVAALLNLGTENVDWWNLGAPSTALAHGDFYGALSTWISNNPDELVNIGAVVICSGINDAATVYLPDIYTQLNALATLIKNSLPNAVPYIGFIGWLDESVVTSDTRVAALREQVAEAYMRAESFGMRYLNGVENFYHDKRLVVDGIHPTSDGAVRLAEGIVNALTVGAASIVNHFSASPTAVEGTVGGSYTQHIQNGLITTTLDGIGVNYGGTPKTINAGNTIDIAECNTAFSNGVDFGLREISINSGGVNLTMIGRLYIYKVDNRLKFQVYSFSDGNTSKSVAYISAIYASATQTGLSC